MKGHFNNAIQQGEPPLSVRLADSPPIGNDGLLFASQDQKHKMYSESTMGGREGRHSRIFGSVLYSASHLLK